MNVKPQFNLDAEKSVLGAIILNGIREGNNKVLSDLSLKAEDFYSTMHQGFFRAMVAADRAGEPITLLILAERIKEGIGDLSEYTDQAVTTANIKYHAAIIQEYAHTRRLQRLCMEILQGLNDDTFEKIDDALAAINKGVAGILRGQGNEVISMEDVAKDVIERVEIRTENKGSISGIPSGFADLDSVTDGFQNGDFIILAGRPGKGKSALAMAIVEYAARAGYPCGVISLEMGKYQLGIRALASLSQVEIWRLRKGLLSKEQLAAAIKASGVMASLPVFFSFSAREIGEIQRTITKMSEINGVKLIVLDYLQLARNPEVKKREREIGEISTLLKHMARTYEVPILCLAQLNREVERREGQRPILSDLRESGQQEQDADVVMFIYPSQEENVVTLEVAKGRNIGITGDIQLYWDKERMTFKDFAKPSAR